MASRGRRIVGSLVAAAMLNVVGLGMARFWKEWLAVALGLIVVIGCAAGLAARVAALRRDGFTVFAAIAARRALSRQRVMRPGQLYIGAPTGAAFLALGSLPSVFLALVTTSGPHHAVRLPPVRDAHAQLWCVAILALVIAIAVDLWFGAATVLRALSVDRFTAGSVAVSLTLAATGPVLVLGRERSQPMWLALVMLQFAWMLGGFVLGAAATARRKVTAAGHAS